MAKSNFEETGGTYHEENRYLADINEQAEEWFLRLRYGDRDTHAASFPIYAVDFFTL